MTQKIDYARLCQELKTEVLDSWQEYAVLRLPIHDDPSRTALWFGPQTINGLEATYILKTICPSTGKIYAVRIPPNLASAREAATWLNWGIDPEQSAVETIKNAKRRYQPEIIRPPDDSCLWDVHCILDEDE